MPRTRRRDAEAILVDFVASHPGLRMGRLFGTPAAYAGRRVFARVSDRGLDVRLPPAAHEAAVGARTTRRRPRGSRGAAWTTVHVGPQSAAAVGSFLEIAARHAAEASLTTVAREAR